MVSVGSIRIYSGSEVKRGLRYSRFFGDKDAAVYRKVVESSRYGVDVEIKKKPECVS